MQCRNNAPKERGRNNFTLSFPNLNKAVDAYLAVQDKLIVYERSPEDGFKQQSANGLSIWYPPTWNKYETRDEPPKPGVFDKIN